jgi:arylsulfatase A-like enzyme
MLGIPRQQLRSAYTYYLIMPVSRRTFFFGSLALPAFAAKKKPEVLRPGILLMLADELPAFMLGAYGNKEVRTPNLDRLGQMGIRFTNHFACAPAPAAGRNTLLTGRTPMQLGESGSLAADDQPLAKILGAAGYASQEGDAAAALQFLDGQSAGKPFFFTLNCPSLRPPYDGVMQKYLDLYARQPFDGYAPDRTAANARSGNEMLRNILGNVRKAAGAVSALDDQAGPVLAKLRARGLLDTTLVIFTAASGGLWGRHGLWDAAAASDPPNMFDDAVATPILWSWLGHVPAIAQRPDLVSAYDFVPTVCDLLSLTAPQRNLCGQSYAPLVTGKPMPKLLKKARPRLAICAHYGNTDMVRGERYKMVSRDQGKGANELYDLVVDPGEKANQFDNPNFLTVQTELTGELAKWREKYSA